MITTQEKRFFESFARLKKSIFLLLSEKNINLTESVALRNIHEHGTTVDIQHELHINKSAVSQMLTNLEKKELIQRNVNPNDRRKHDISLTIKGMHILQETKERNQQIMEEAFQRMGTDKSLIFIELLENFSIVTEKMSLEIKSPSKEEP
ncbi:MAG: MarR family transcriptional regulator [Eubacteriales bacterium]